MKHLIFSIALLLMLLAAGIFSSLRVQWVQEPIATQLEQAAQAGFSENWELAGSLFEKAQTRWNTYRNALATVTDHGPMEEIDSLFDELEFYRRAKDPVLFSSLCGRLSQLAEAVGESLRFSWWNLL